SYNLLNACPESLTSPQSVTLLVFLFQTQADGTASIDKDIPVASPPTGFVNTQSTKADGAKSPFSNCQSLAPPCTLDCSQSSAQTTGIVGSPVSFTGSAMTNNCTGSPVYDWDFGDATTHSSSQSPQHSYSTSGTKHWTLTVTISGAAPCMKSGDVVVSPPCTLDCSQSSAPSTGTAG